MRRHRTFKGHDAESLCPRSRTAACTVAAHHIRWAQTSVPAKRIEADHPSENQPMGASTWRTKCRSHRAMPAPSRHRRQDGRRRAPTAPARVRDASERPPAGTGIRQRHLVVAPVAVFAKRRMDNVEACTKAGQARRVTARTRCPSASSQPARRLAHDAAARRAPLGTARRSRRLLEQQPVKGSRPVLQRAIQSASTCLYHGGDSQTPAPKH